MCCQTRLSTMVTKCFGEWDISFCTLVLCFSLFVVPKIQHQLETWNVPCDICISILHHIYHHWLPNFVMHHSLLQHTLPWELPLIARNTNIAWRYKGKKNPPLKSTSLAQLALLYLKLVEYPKWFFVNSCRVKTKTFVNWVMLLSWHWHDERLWTSNPKLVGAQIIMSKTSCFNPK